MHKNLAKDQCQKTNLYFCKSDIVFHRKIKIVLSPKNICKDYVKHKQKTKNLHKGQQWSFVYIF